jgi:hypothetical protein
MKKYFLILLILTGLLSSCIENDGDLPPTTGEDPNIAVTATIAQVKAMYTGTAMELDDSLVVSGVIVADDESGNFYKSIVIQDASAGILIRMDASELYKTYPVGRRIFIKLGGLWIGEYNGLIQLGGGKAIGTVDQVDLINSTLFDKVILKGTFNNEVIPMDVDINSLNSSHQNMLIRLQNVQFIVSDTNKQYAPGLVSQNLYLEDCGATQVIVRTSGYCNFATQEVPNLNGEFVCIYSEFGTTKQLLIRDPSDLKMNGQRCGPYVKKDFEDGSVTSGGWTTQQVSGPSINWTTNTQGAQNGTYYGQCSNYVTPNNIPCEAWLISPAFDLTAAVNPAMSFANAWKYTGPSLTIWVSTNYVSGLPSTAAWTNITTSAAWSPGNFSWQASGYVSLLSYIGNNNVHIAFKYLGTGSNGSTWEVDDIIVTEI